VLCHPNPNPKNSNTLGGRDYKWDIGNHNAWFSISHLKGDGDITLLKAASMAGQIREDFVHRLRRRVEQTFVSIESLGDGP